MPVTDTDGQIRCKAQAQAAAPDRRHYGTGVGWSLTSAFLWATTYISGRFLMSADAVDPVTLSMQYLTPVFTILLARLILGERMTWPMAAGAALVLLGVALSSERRPRFAHPRDSRV